MSTIRFHNTLGRQRQDFVPLVEGRAQIYTSGPTVYNQAHIGNLRTFVFEDVLCRALERLGFEVTQVMNLTDVEDKIIAGSLAAGMTIEEFVAPHIETFFADLKRLHVKPAAVYPRATEHVAEMISMIETLMEKGIAYEADGSVFFRIEADEDYGRLTGVDPSEHQRGQRVAADEYGKEDVRDFVLWKGVKPGEPSWPSPWGDGRPGWHIECSAMSMKYLGETFDIHCGGVDNAFPHHENEIAQSESASGEVFSRYWLHSEHLLVEGQKMSKSLGNQYTLDDLVEKGIDLRAVRYLFVSVHYRQKLNFTFDSVKTAESALRRIDEMRFRLDSAAEGSGGDSRISPAIEELDRAFDAALAEDLNLSGALGAVHQFARAVNSAVDSKALISGDRQRVSEALRGVDAVLGVLHSEDWADASSESISALSDAEVEKLLAERRAAREAGDWGRADEIRDRLSTDGIVLEDQPGGTRWRRGQALGGS